MTRERESRPSTTAGAAPDSVVATHPHDTETGTVPHLTATDARQRLTDCYAVVVAGKTIRKHLYFGLPAAERAVRQAHARGAVAHLVLVRLVPVDHRQLDQLEAVIAGE